ncbi:MAG: helix-turn-helix transcriptional regulator [Ruminococcus sp.]|nr:helix-turn-helix transcriptional regulator [Ruminococcus sp.]
MTAYCYPVYNDLKALPLCVCGVGIREIEAPLKRAGGYPFHQLILCLEGEGKMIAAGKKYDMRKGSVVYIPVDTAHEFTADKTMLRLFTLDLSGEGLTGILESVRLVKVRCERLDKSEPFAMLLSSIMEIVRSGGSSAAYESSAKAFELLIMLHKALNLTSDNPDGQKYSQLAPVIKYIDENYRSEMSLDDLAAMISKSPQYLCRLFKECYKMRPFEYLARKRIQMAKLMLVEDGYNVNEVSQFVGYNDCSYFCSVFKKHEGISPAEFRSLNCAEEK